MKYDAFFDHIGDPQTAVLSFALAIAVMLVIAVAATIAADHD